MAATFHAGELAMQRRAGVAARLQEIGDKVIRDHMPDQHRAFFRQLPTLVVGSVDAQRRPWASMLVGEPGFVSDADARHLRIDAWPDAGDPLAAHLAIGAPLGLLGLEPSTRRRNRMNGRVVAMPDTGGFEVEVDQSFGNCPQYIQARTPRRVDARGQAAHALGPALNAAARALIERADTLFIASATPALASAGAAQTTRSDGVDVSHRGGKPGFVRVEEDDRGAVVLTWPDFRGNFYFNTLGNLVAHPRAGLLFVDHANGDLLQLSGAAEVIAEGAELRSFDGAQYLVRLRVQAAVWRPQALPLRWSAPEAAQQLAATGAWAR
jgi:predicted pyridoxine 5'-phosphate oxidase superfamily flavin-nucleotide-binding protein